MAPTPPMSPVERPPHRLDALDGLRTVAVGLVVAFHVAAPGLASGFAGVDVFFVLSGYLITSGLVREVERTGTVGLLAFWTRRLRRLMPAAMLVLATVAAWAWGWAPAFRRPGIGSDLFMTLVYLANWHFMAAGSYFAADGTQSPLLHMWSLAVEEQFYLAWPLLFLLLARLSRRRRPHPADAGGPGRPPATLGPATVVCALLVVASAALLAVLQGAGDAPDRAYMGTDSKAFEPLLGALAALLVSRPAVRERATRHARVLGTSGVVVAGALLPLLAGPARPYFSGGALGFSLATAAVVVACALAPRWWFARLMALPPLAYLGRISYGIYLWHWPLAVWLDAHAAWRPGRAALVVAGTIALASASYHLVEQPILTGRLRPWLTTGRTIAVAAAAMAVMACVAAPLGRTPLTPLARRILPAPPLAGTTLVVVGDSVPQRLMPVLSEHGRRRGLEVVSATRGGCSPLGVQQTISADDTSGSRCPEVVATQEDALAATNPATVLWWSRYEVADRRQGDEVLTPADARFWQAQADDFAKAVDRLTARGATLVVVLTEPPGIGMDSRCTPDNCHPFLRRLVDEDHYRRQWNQLVKEVAARDPRVRTITVEDVACPQVVGGVAQPAPAVRCNDRFNRNTLYRPDGSHWDNDFAGPLVERLLDRTRDATVS